MKKKSTLIIVVISVILLIFTVNALNNKQKDEIATESTEENVVIKDTETETEEATEVSGPVLDENGMITVGETKFLYGYTAERDENTVTLPEESEEICSKHVILIDESTNKIVAGKNYDTVLSPASMTKIMTVLVAAELIEKNDELSLDDKFKITREISDYAYVNDCSTAGFVDNEKVLVRDLFFGTILPSGGEAAVSLATYAAGSHEAFVECMNQKLEELGLSETAHFTNCVGLYDEEHHCTVYDMAMILKAAAENDWCREVLSTHIHKTAKTKKHKEGLTLSNLFLRRIEDHESGGTVMCAKTGFVNQSGCCAASYEISDSGVPYICVTANTYSSWRAIFDHVAVYSKYGK